MVANLSAHKAGWDDRWREFSDYAETGRELLDRMLALVDEDTAAFNRIMDAMSLPKGTEEERRQRTEAMESATEYATSVPLKTVKAAVEAYPLLLAMATHGNPASASDAGVGALAATACAKGALLNVRINAASLADRAKAEALVAEGTELVARAIEMEKQILDKVNEIIDK